LASDVKLQIIPLGGLGEFGMNSMALRYGDDIIVIDAGMMFPDVELLGVDIVTPDFTYLLENKDKVRALILTHGHEDHIGGVPFLLADLNIPVYGTAFTLALVERRLEEHEFEDANLNKVAPRDKVKIGPFAIEFLSVTHSMPSCLGLAITTPLGVIIHTGDFKIDPTPIDGEQFDLHTLAEYGKRGVLALMMDSTNVDRPGSTLSERAVRPKLEEIFRSTERRLVISCFSSSIPRIQQVLDIAHAAGRKVCLIGRSMVSTTEIAHSLGHLTIPDGLLVRPQDAMDVPPRKMCVLISGTQGEPMSALSRVALDHHRHVSIEAGDTLVLSARMIPGNEKAIGRMLNHFARRGAKLIYGSTTPPIHVSGHASREELKMVLNLVRPKYFIPIHGEFRQLSEHADLAREVLGKRLEGSFVLDTGDTVVMDRVGARKGDRVTVGHVCIDSGSLDEVVENEIIRDRRHLAEDGFVLPIVAVNKNNGQLEGPPEIVSRGFVSFDEGSALLDEARQIVLRTFETVSEEERADLGVLKEKIRLDLKRFLNKSTQRRPLIAPVIVEV
jgi:ribonuclease J